MPLGECTQKLEGITNYCRDHRKKLRMARKICGTFTEGIVTVTIDFIYN